jgi:hypothetical protein
VLEEDDDDAAAEVTVRQMFRLDASADRRLNDRNAVKQAVYGKQTVSRCT